LFKKVDRKASRQKKQMSIRNKISGTPERPRLSVFRSNTNIFAQLIDDVNGVTLVSASTIDKALKGSIANGGNVEAAKAIGKAIAERAKEKGIKEIDETSGRYYPKSVDDWIKRAEVWVPRRIEKNKFEKELREKRDKKPHRQPAARIVFA